MTYSLSIETVSEGAYQHGYHLGTDLAIAKQCAEDVFNQRNRLARELGADRACHRGYQLLTRTVALFLDGKMIDCYDGDAWSSDYGNAYDES